MAKISQREAHRLQRQVRTLVEADMQRKRTYARDYPGGVNVASLTVDDVTWAKLEVSRRLGRALVVTVPRDKLVLFYAI